MEPLGPRNMCFFFGFPGWFLKTWGFFLYRMLWGCCAVTARTLNGDGVALDLYAMLLKARCIATSNKCITTV